MNDIKMNGNVIELKMDKPSFNELLTKATVVFLITLIIVTALFSIVSNNFGDQLKLQKVDPTVLLSMAAIVYVLWNFFALQLGVWKIGVIISVIIAYIVMQSMEVYTKTL